MKQFLLLSLCWMLLAATCAEDYTEPDECKMEFYNDTENEICIHSVLLWHTKDRTTIESKGAITISGHSSMSVGVVIRGYNTWKTALSGREESRLNALYTLVFSSKSDYYRWLADIEGQELTEELINNSEYVVHVYKFTKDNVPDERTLYIRYTGETGTDDIEIMGTCVQSHSNRRFRYTDM